ncbi:hypothetical protein D3C76_798490 [compost metagenome]
MHLPNQLAFVETLESSGVGYVVKDGLHQGALNCRATIQGRNCPPLIILNGAEACIAMHAGIELIRLIFFLMHTMENVALGKHRNSHVKRSRRHRGDGLRQIRGRWRHTLVGLGTLFSHGQYPGSHPVRQQSPDQAPMPAGPGAFYHPENCYLTGTSKPDPSRPCGHRKPQ